MLPKPKWPPLEKKRPPLGGLWHLQNKMPHGPAPHVVPRPPPFEPPAHLQKKRKKETITLDVKTINLNIVGSDNKVTAHSFPIDCATYDRERKTITLEDEDVMERMTELCIFDKFRYKKSCDSAERPARFIDAKPCGGSERAPLYSDDPYSLGLRKEHLLSVANTQRAIHLARRASRNDARANLAHALVFNSDDMKEIMNEWRKQPQTWMDSKSLAKVNEIENRQAYHQACKKRFSTMLFQLYGNKSLVDILI